MKNRQLYLSERIYEKETEVRIDKIKYDKWSRLLGQNKLNAILQTDEKICKYLGDKEYSGRKAASDYNCTKSKNVDAILRTFSEKNMRILFAPFYTEWARRGLYSFRAAVKSFDLCTEQIYLDYLDILFKKMETASLRILIQELHYSKDAGGLKGEDSKEEYQYYVDALVGKSEYQKEIYEKYPVLMRCMTETVEMTTKNMIRLIENFHNDKEQIESCLLGGAKSGGIRNIRGNIADSHKGGESVLELILENGAHIIYKPHSVNNEIVFQEWIHLFCDSLNISCYAPQIISREGYGWEGYVEYKTCHEKKEISRYYYRMGIYIFIAHLLQANDLHFENLIVHGEYPVLVDMEALVGPRKRSLNQPVNEIIREMLQESVLNIGILPSHHWSASDEGIDISAMNNQEKQVLPIKVPVVKNAFTSDIYIDYRYGEIKNTKNIVKFRETKIDAKDYVNEVIEGFSDAYEYAKSHRKDVRDMSEKMGNLLSRYLLADTQKYSMTLSSSYHPSLMMDAADRELYFYILWNEGEEDKRNKLIILKSEMQDLIQGDIPSFDINLKDKNLYWHDQVIVRDYLDESPIDGIKRKIDNLCDKDRLQQVTFIEVSMTAGGNTKQTLEANKWEKTSARRQATVDEAIDVLAQKIMQMSICDNHNHVNWVNYIITNDNYSRWQMDPCGMYFYDGLSGVALLFHMLLKYKRMPGEYEETCNMLDRQLFEYTEKVELDEKLAQSMNSGLYNGEASIVWTYLMIYRLNGEEKYLYYAERHGNILYKIAVNDNANDMMDGKAGAILGLIYLYQECGKEKYLSWAKDVEARLSKNAIISDMEMAWNSNVNDHPLLGMAHGNAGISVAYGKLFEYTGITDYCSKLEKILRYEHNRFNEKTEDWYDYRYKERVLDAEKEPAAWCHGAGGILSARLELKMIKLPAVIEGLIEADIKKAVKRVKDTYMRDAMCLCHGTCGNLLILNKYLKLYKDSHISKICKEGFGYVTNGIALENGIGMRKEYSINVMNGYAGILLYLLQTDLDIL